MKNEDKPIHSLSKDDLAHSRAVLEDFFIDSLKEMYYAEKEIANEFDLIKDHIISSKLKEILKTHFAIHLKHKERLEKIFKLRNEVIESKECPTFNALICEAKNHLAVFSTDIDNWK
ncbi:DUF892 family protein [Kaistella flava (ex Peng et al. 2021)]|uniref:DUF892 family protein n=1 Tax=Kaistella flava (ex Peng et al. 2021) TaxID=2038776 RepID=A0A7M2YBS1_9FLAO|nr:DUF892 family protein [Kaistella flava (ex Peng et al. 2021)]QOW11677.1 DUF892 family protein [Kaistella flava (ex Peng et al. 2021)]